MLNKISPTFLRVLLLLLPVVVAFSCGVDQNQSVDMGGVEGDRATLEALYKETEGNTWVNNDYWNTDMLLCKWHGVTTDPDSGRVTQLNLSGNQLEGEIPSELGNLAMLELLDLSNNRLTGRIPPELGNLNILQVLWLQDNQLEGEIPSELADTSAPRWLHLSNNRLNGQIPWSQGQTLFDGTSLPELGLWGNQLEGEIPVYFRAAVERAALRDLYAKTDGENWADKDNWLDFHVPLSDWYGVTLDAAGRVTGLDLSGNRLEGNIPNGLGVLSDLENLNLADNAELVGSLPLNLMDLPNFITLDISGTRLCAPVVLKEWLDSEKTAFQGETCEEISVSLTAPGYTITEGESATVEIPFTIDRTSSAGDDGTCSRTESVRAKLVDLVKNTYPTVASCADVTAGHLATVTGSLDLSGSSIESLKAGDFSGLTNLTTLYLSRNQLDALPEGVFAGLTSLEYLNLSYNQLRVLPVGLFSGLTNLTVLHLARNQLSTLPEGVFAGLTSLKDLDLWFNQLRTLPAGVFSGLTSLQDLDLEENELQTLPAGVFSGLRLRFLGLEGNELSTLPAGVFTNLDVTLTLDLSHNYLHTLPAGVFSGLTNLPFLDLSVNQLSELPAGLLSGLTSLTSLWIDQNPGAPFVFAMIPKRIPGTNKVVVTVAYGAPFSMATTITATTISMIGEAPMTTVFPVTVLVGHTTSDEIVVTSLGMGAMLTLGMAPSVPMSQSVSATAFLGIKTAVCSLETSDMALDQVTGVKITEGVEQLAVSWKVACGASGYKVQWKSGSQLFDSARQHTITSGSKTSYKISRLVAGTVYTVRVVATKSNAADGTPSSEVIGTPEAPGLPNPAPVPAPVPAPNPAPVPAPNPAPVPIDDRVQGGESGGGCAIVSSKAAYHTPESTLLSLFLVVSVLFLQVLGKVCSRGKQV